MVIIPALDFQKLKADLYVDLAYTNNLLRQRVHRDNLVNLVAQITECLRLIRCRVATAAAYIQTDAFSTISTSSTSGDSSKTTSSASDPPESTYYSVYFPFVDEIIVNYTIQASGYITIAENKGLEKGKRDLVNGIQEFTSHLGTEE
ncbi:hypothetical protein ACTXT7_001357 [Hymenolepis weldensis]